MKTSPERQALEKALENEKAGSAKIRALADYALFEDIVYKIRHRKGNLSQLETQKIALEIAMEQKFYGEDAYDYLEASGSAQEILAPYYEKYNGYPGEVLLEDLREINREKSRK